VNLELTSDERRRLLEVAEEAVRARLEDRPAVPLDLPPHLVLPGATFVTLRMPDDRLLGCVGTMVPNRSLVDDVASNAVGSAFADPRLPSLTPAEFEVMEIKISVLGPLEQMAVDTYAELTTMVKPGVDGLLIDAGAHRATFLPSVWEQVDDDVRRFLELLWRKAGLRPTTWPRRMTIWRYDTVEFGTAGPRRPVAVTR
jgi:AmmeMemoRadiSam system protein A